MRLQCKRVLEGLKRSVNLPDRNEVVERFGALVGSCGPGGPRPRERHSEKTVVVAGPSGHRLQTHRRELFTRDLGIL